MKTGSLLIAAGLCAACAASAPGEAHKPLPFHVALAPLAPADIRADHRTGGEGDATDMRIEPNSALLSEISQALAASLRERAFTKVTLLEPPTSADAGSESGLQYDMEMLRAAQRNGADLLLRLELSLQPVIREEKNSVFWVNFPLFFLGGPFGWWLSDRTYFADLEVAGWFYEPRRLANRTIDSTLRSARSEVASVSRRAERLDLDFNDRAQGDAGDYLLSMVWPCGFLAVESEDLRQNIVQQVVEQIGEGLSRRILEQSVVLERGDAPFFLDLAQSELARDPDGGFVLRGMVDLAPTREIESLGAWRVTVGSGGTRVHSFDSDQQPTVEGGYRRYRLEEPLGLLAEGTCVLLEIEGGERAPRVRSYTFMVRSDRP